MDKNQVVYSGQVYVRASDAAKMIGKNIDECIPQTNGGARNVLDVKARKGEFLATLDANGVRSEVDGYIASRHAYRSFCNVFFIESDQYLLNIDKIIKEGEKIVDATKDPIEAKIDFSQIGELLDMMLEEQRTLNKTLIAFMTSFNTIVGSIELKEGSSLDILQRVGPKLGEMDKKMKNIETSAQTVSKTYTGLANNVAGIKSAIDRWMSGR